MNGHISTQVKPNCYNFYESYGEICVGCGCCSTNKLERAKARLALHKRILDEDEHFSNWIDDPYLRKQQEKNLKREIALNKELIARYEARVKKYTEETTGNV